MAEPERAPGITIRRDCNYLCAMGVWSGHPERGRCGGRSLKGDGVGRSEPPNSTVAHRTWRTHDGRYDGDSLLAAASGSHILAH